MATTDPRVDEYIEKSADFAKPILKHLRKLVHRACPEVEETIKWRFPTFMHKGMLCGMAAFKEHCTFGFWKGDLILGPDGTRADSAMGHFGRITKRADLPRDEVLLGYLREAIRLNEAGIKVPRKPKPKVDREPLVVPPFLDAAFKTKPKARTAFENFSYSHKKEYLEWLTEAKREETRNKRLSTALAWMEQGKSRNWKYVNC